MVRLAAAVEVLNSMDLGRLNVSAGFGVLFSWYRWHVWVLVRHQMSQKVHAWGWLLWMIS
jgi:hypothetical protein